MSDALGNGAIVVYGEPRPKGSFKCVGSRGRHRLVPTDGDVVAWQNDLAAGLLDEWQTDAPFLGPVIVEATVTLSRPNSVTPKSRPYPTKSSPGHGDVDKLARPILDALVDARVIDDDAQVVELLVRKVYPDSPNAPDPLSEPGVVLRVYGMPNDAP